MSHKKQRDKQKFNEMLRQVGEMILLKKMLVTILCILSGIILAAEVTSKTVEADGFGENIEAAMKNARENAVRVAFGEVVDSLSEIKNEELLESTISVSSGFILSHKIINPPKYDQANRYYSVKIEAVVATEKIKDHVNRLKKTSSEVDMSALMQADDDVEIQEKNFVELIKWWNMMIAKNLSFHNFSIQFTDSENFTISYDTDLPPHLVQHLNPIAEKVLLANGFSTSDHDGIATVNVGNTRFTHPDIDRQVRGVGDWVITHVISTHNGEKFTLYTTGLTQMFHIAYIKPQNMLVTDILFPHSSKKSVIREELKPEYRNIKSVQIYAKYYDIFGNQYSEPFLLKEFPVDSNDFTARQESFSNREKAIQDIITNMYRESFKFYIPKAELLRYNKKKQVAVVKISTTTDKRGYVKFARKIISQFKSLNFAGREKVRIELPTRTFEFSLPDGAMSISDYFHNISKKYTYHIMLKFKDEEGEILQEYELDINFYTNTMIYCSHPAIIFKPANDYEGKIEIKFDIPEDAELVKSIECSIIEREKQ